MEKQNFISENEAGRHDTKMYFDYFDNKLVRFTHSIISNNLDMSRKNFVRYANDKTASNFYIFRKKIYIRHFTHWLISRRSFLSKAVLK